MKNFNGVMAIVSSLQQGCITRMELSLKLLPTDDQESLQRLKALRNTPSLPSAVLHIISN